MSTVSKETVHIVSTERMRWYLTLLAFLYAFGIAIDRSAISIAVALTVFLAFVRGYTSLCTTAVEHLRVSIPNVIGFEGERKVVEIILENRSIIPILFLEISIAYSPFLRLVDGSRAYLVFLPPRGRIVLRMVFLARIGRHSIGPIKAVVRDPLGLFRSREMEIGTTSYLEVYPQTSEVVLRKLLAISRTVGIARSKQRGVGVEIHSLREYNIYDDVRRIVWKYYASRQRLVVKELEKETVQNVFFIIDATQPMSVGPYSLTPLEHCVRIVTSISRYLASRGDRIHITYYTNSSVYMMPNIVRGVGGYREVLKFISGIPFEEREVSDEDRAMRIYEVAKSLINILPRERNAVFIFTTYGGFSYFEALNKFIKSLMSIKNDVYIIVPIITTYELKGLPEWGQTLFRVREYTRIKNELEFVKSLKRVGAKAIATSPDYIPQIVVSIIEMLRH